ncbi:hypothetical protein [Natronorubrum daqingense]|uniref:Uncharacterized protein n=1 Tax=Natronorubrum daqingense TaxID=588898 RepID=A0A1N7AIK6_9EURY|nr:hypothetical protein [Natronorubrum daqingense]APX97969.1 hypothetical protein BB347_15890 [Natronorubrum daqingense]SIR38821.1 hypothetical protein SAMN05421809_1182 [Natronorubrum daqingense]
MSDLVMVLLAGALFLQFPAAIVVHFDAKRLGLENPEMYELGIIVPMAGFLVIFYYASQRGSLPRADSPTE